MGVKRSSWVRTTAGHLALVVGPRLVEARVAFGVVVHVGVGSSAVDEVDCFGVVGGGAGGGGPSLRPRGLPRVTGHRRVRRPRRGGEQCILAGFGGLLRDFDEDLMLWW